MLTMALKKQANVDEMLFCKNDTVKWYSYRTWYGYRTR